MQLLAILEVARQSLHTMLRSRLLWLVVPLEVLAVLVPWLILENARVPPGGREAFCLTAFWFHLFLLTPWIGMFYGVQAVHGDIEDRSFQYLFLRPVPRWVLLLGKWLSAAVITTALAGFGMLVLMGGMSLMSWDWPSGYPETELLPMFFASAALAGAAYTSVAVLFGVWFRRPMVWSVFFVVGFEFFVSNLPSGATVRSFTVADPVRRFLLDWLEPTQKLARQLWPSQRNFDPEQLGTPLVSLAQFVVFNLLLAVWIYGRTEYDSRPRD